MDFSGRIVLSYIEEDNVQRSYFRVRPLLTADGAIAQAEIDELKDCGYLRVVPDKNEQHSFKERMRGFGSMCILDLTNLPADAVKIRSNKNYAPQRGENNQFIVYSDAVRPVPQQLFYEVITAEAGDREKIALSATPLCYLRSGGRIHGPVSRVSGAEQEDTALLPPDSEGLYAVTLPDGSEKLFYWPRSVLNAAAPNEKPAEAAEKKEKDAARPLNGMPLYRTVARRPVVQRRAHNPLMDTVDHQLRASKLEPPGAQVAPGTAMRQLENPVDAFKRALDKLWPMPELQRQAAAHFLSMTGVQNILDEQLAGHAKDTVIAAVNSQIQDLEAERLALLMQLEGAGKNLAQLRQEALAKLNEEETGKIQRLRQEEADARADLEKINAERSRLIAERDAAIAEMKRAGTDTLRLAAELGGHAGLDTLCERVQLSMRCQGLACTRDDALHLLALLCVCDGKMELCAPAAADAIAGAKALALALGAVWVYNEKAGRRVCVEQGGDALRLVITPLTAQEKLEDCVCLLAGAGNSFADAGVYQRTPWPRGYIAALPTWQYEAAPVFPAVRADAVYKAVLGGQSVPPQAALRLIDEVDTALRGAGAPLAQCVRRSVYRYLAVTATQMEGGIARALDEAVCAWIVPHMMAYGVAADAVKALLPGLAKSLALLEGLSLND